MSGVNYLDGDTADQCHQALRDGRTLEDVAGRLHMDTELLGRLLQLPTVQSDVAQPDPNYLWSADRLDAVL